MQLKNNTARVFAALALIAMVNVYVFANGAVASGKALFGKLVTVSNRPVSVNGAEAITGTVILSGTQIVTPAAGGATVELQGLGSVMVAPDSNVTLAFDLHNVNVNVLSGNASVATVDGVKGTVLGAGNAPGAPGSNSAPNPAGGNSAKNWGIAGVAIGGGAFIWAIIAWNKAGNADDAAKAAQAQAATLASQLAALRTCLAGQTSSPVKLCTSF